MCCRTRRCSPPRAPAAGRAARRRPTGSARWPGGRRTGRSPRAATAAACAACRVASVSRATASRKVSWPLIRITPSARLTRMCSAPPPSAPSTIGPIRPPCSVRLEHDRAGPVSEHGRRRAVVGIGDARHQVGADDQHHAGAAGLDLRGRRPPAPRESRCRPSRRRRRPLAWRRARARPAARRPASARRRWWSRRSPGRRRADRRPRSEQRLAGRLRRVRVKALIGRGDPARADPGAADDPVLARRRAGRRPRRSRRRSRER